MKFSYGMGLIGLTTALMILAFNVQAQPLDEPESSTQAPDTSAQQMETSDSKDLPKFTDVDANKDGVITRDEASETWLADNFKQFDLNLDGYINESEYDQARS